MSEDDINNYQTPKALRGYRPVRYELSATAGVVAVRGVIESGWEKHDPEASRGSTRGEVSSWSAKSRMRFARAIASSGLCDLALPVEYAWCMVTLTYPLHWRQVCPDGPTSKRQLKALLQWVRRNYAQALPDHELRGCWKLEFQPRVRVECVCDRQAPHFHILLPLPVTDPGLRPKLSLAWASIVGATGDEYTKHLRAGTAIDWTEGARCASDPKRMAVYFLKHSAPGEVSVKAAQHQLPDDFPNPGRWWAMIGKNPSPATVEVAPGAYTNIRRALRKVASSRAGYDAGIRTARPAATTTVVRPRHRHRWTEHGDGVTTLTRLPTARKVTRRTHSLDAGYRAVGEASAATAVDPLIPGGWVLSCDGRRLAVILLEHFATLDLALQLANQEPAIVQRSLPPVQVVDAVLDDTATKAPLNVG